MSGPKAKIIIHIGQHKTGSKALQSFLAHHAGALASRGILYPVEQNPLHGIRAYAESHYRMFALLRRETVIANGDPESSARFWDAQAAFCQPFESLRGMFEFLEAERVRTGAGTILLSAEDLFDMHSAHELKFSPQWIGTAARILAGLIRDFQYDPTLVAYLRRQDHLLGAHYVQYIKGSSIHDLDFETFHEAFAPRLHSRDLLAPWATAFGAKHLQVRPYERAALPMGIVPDFFEKTLGFPVPPDWTPPPSDPESVNATPDRDHVEFIRILNRRNSHGKPVFHREDVLEAALRGRYGQIGGTGIAAWLSPDARRALLQVHAPGNAQIAHQYFSNAGPLFAEPLPENDGTWREYPGFSAEIALAIACEIHEISSGRRK
jgi:hypothetical protein